MIRVDQLSQKWPKVCLGDIVEFLDHKRKPITAKDRVPGPYPYYGANGQQDSVDGYIFDEPLVLVAEDGGYFGNPNRNIAYQVEGKCWVNNHVHVLRPTSKIHIRYLCRHLEKYDVRPYINGATREKLNKGAAQEIIISLPPLEEQKRIAAILDKADAIRRKRQQAIDLTDQLLRSVFLDMFGDPVTNPKGWIKAPLAELCAAPLQNGAYYPKESYTNDNTSGVGMVHMSDAFYGFANIKSAKRVDVPEKDIKKYGLLNTDLLIARRSLTLEGSAKPCRIRNLSESVIYESSLIRVRPDLSKVLPEYLYYYLSDERARQKYLLKFVTSSTISGINQGNLAKVLILVPDLNVQKKFVDFLKKCEFKINHQVESKSIIESLVSSTTQQAFRGELTKPTKAT